MWPDAEPGTKMDSTVVCDHKLLKLSYEYDRAFSSQLFLVQKIAKSRKNWKILLVK